jgi:hypothetical protein
MYETLQDIETLALRCRSDQSRTYIAEAVICYRSGAYRATIVSVWIAVIFDLIDKIRELSLAGDGNAKAILQRYETYMQQMDRNDPRGVKNALEFERELLSTCRDKLEFFDQQQIVDLERLREDRHRCAHPSFQRVGEPYRPTAEQARLHLTNAVLHVLAQPPVQGKALLNQLRVIVSSSYFPTDRLQAVAALRASALARPNEALVNGFIDMVVFEPFKADSPLYNSPRAADIVNAAAELHRTQVETRLQKQLNRMIFDATDPEMPAAVFLLAGVESGWQFLEEAAKAKVKQYVSVSPIPLVLPTLGRLRATPELVSVIKEKLATASRDELATAISSFGLRDVAKDRALELLSQVGTFNTANDVIQRIIFPIFETLSKQDFIKIIEFPRTAGADLVGANAYSALVARLRDSSFFTSAELDGLLIANNAAWMVQTDASQ